VVSSPLRSIGNEPGGASDLSNGGVIANRLGIRLKSETKGDCKDRSHPVEMRISGYSTGTLARKAGMTEVDLMDWYRCVSP
jgi:hypothetical protein